MGFGWFVLPVFCGAYVELQTDHLQVVSAMRQLRIYCAGVWHNFASSILAVGLWWSLPYFYLLFYSTENGAVISDVYKVSMMTFHFLPLFEFSSQMEIKILSYMVVIVNV